LSLQRTQVSFSVALTIMEAPQLSVVTPKSLIPFIIGECSLRFSSMEVTKTIINTLATMRRKATLRKEAIYSEDPVKEALKDSLISTTRTVIVWDQQKL
jgi:hypothetical protein